MIWPQGYDDRELVFSALNQLKTLVRIMCVKMLTSVTKVMQVAAGTELEPDNEARASTSAESRGIMVALRTRSNIHLQTLATGLSSKQAAGLSSKQHGLFTLQFLIMQQIRAAALSNGGSAISGHVTMTNASSEELALRALGEAGVPSVKTLLHHHNTIDVPHWMTNLHFTSVEVVDASNLRVKCAASVGRCRQGHTTALEDSPHFAYASRAPGGDGLYSTYIRHAFERGVEISDHSVAAFRTLRDTFDATAYPQCTTFGSRDQQCVLSSVVGYRNPPGSDRVWIKDGAHRAALLLASGVRSFPVAVFGGHAVLHQNGSRALALPRGVPQCWAVSNAKP